VLERPLQTMGVQWNGVGLGVALGLEGGTAWGTERETNHDRASPHLFIRNAITSPVFASTGHFLHLGCSPPYSLDGVASSLGTRPPTIPRAKILYPPPEDHTRNPPSSY